MIQQRPHRQTCDRIDQVWCDLSERLQHEEALTKSSVRYCECAVIDDLVAVQNQVQIQRPRCIRVRPLTSSLGLDVLKRSEQIVGRQPRVADNGRVQVPWLFVVDIHGRRVVAR